MKPLRFAPAMPKSKTPRNSRESDERILHWMHLADQGWSTHKIAVHTGVNSGIVAQSLRDVRIDDAQYNGDQT